MKQPYNTALYMRLSRDDENYGDSVSIETQRTILQQFAKDNDLHVVGEYIDDGWSGTTFERPNFKRMMADVDAGRVNCIVTKDLSRFGRDHIMVGYYLEYEFPEKQVRYIAVSENEDTKKGLSDFVPFKNLFNEWFAKDTSRKVKTALHAKFAAGERTFAYAPLGYVRHPEIKNAIVIDFLKKHGLSDSEITVNPPQVKDRFADSWSQENIVNRYVASSVIIVNSTQVDLARNIMQNQAELMKIGIALICEEYGNNTIKYEFTGLNGIKPEMVEESTRNARATAEKFAKDSDSELGKIRRATQGQFSITDRDNNTPYIKNVRVVSTIEYYIKD